MLRIPRFILRSPCEMREGTKGYGGVSYQPRPSLRDGDRPLDRFPRVPLRCTLGYSRIPLREMGTLNPSLISLRKRPTRVSTALGIRDRRGFRRARRHG